MTRQPISLLTFGAALSSFMGLSYVICVIGYLVLPDWLMIPHSSLELFLPGFKLLTFGRFVLGVIEVLIFGWYVALVFGALYNFYAARLNGGVVTVS